MVSTVSTVVFVASIVLLEEIDVPGVIQNSLSNNIVQIQIQQQKTSIHVCLMDSTCQICSHLVCKATGRTTLSCGHIFHPHCIHNLFKGSSQCPCCPKPTGSLLDFGDNILIANATRESVYSSATSFPQEMTKKGIFGIFKSKSTYPSSATPEELVDLGAPVQTFQERKITLMDIIKTGVKLLQWIKSGHTLRDLQEMGVKWDDMIYMGLTPNDLSHIPASFLINVLKIDISHLMQIGTTWQHLVQARYTTRDLLALKCTTHVLKGLGMEGDHMSLFAFSESDWRALSLE